jgi:transcriptional regulator with XRE-family HTH domain
VRKGRDRRLSGFTVDLAGIIPAPRSSYHPGNWPSTPNPIWHDRFALRSEALAAAAIPAGYLSEIENGKKPGSVAACRALAKALAVPMEGFVGGE